MQVKLKQLLGYFSRILPGHRGGISIFLFQILLWIFQSHTPQTHPTRQPFQWPAFFFWPLWNTLLRSLLCPNLTLQSLLDLLPAPRPWQPLCGNKQSQNFSYPFPYNQKIFVSSKIFLPSLPITFIWILSPHLYDSLIPCISYWGTSTPAVTGMSPAASLNLC